MCLRQCARRIHTVDRDRPRLDEAEPDGLECQIGLYSCETGIEGSDPVKLRQFEALRQVIARGTTKDAAVAMGLTQSAVSRLVRQLEDEFGFVVFDRRQGRLHLTPEGQRFYTEVEKILGGLDQLQSMAKDISTLSVGTLRLIAMPALGFGLLPAAVEKIQAPQDLDRSRQPPDGRAASTRGQPRSRPGHSADREPLARRRAAVQHRLRVRAAARSPSG